MLNNDKSEQIEMLTKRINDLVDKAEQLGCEGRVEEAQGVMKLCERLKEERTELEEASLALSFQCRVHFLQLTGSQHCDLPLFTHGGINYSHTGPCGCSDSRMLRV